MITECLTLYNMNGSSVQSICMSLTFSPVFPIYIPHTPICFQPHVMSFVFKNISWYQHLPLWKSYGFPSLKLQQPTYNCTPATGKKLGCSVYILIKMFYGQSSSDNFPALVNINNIKDTFESDMILSAGCCSFSMLISDYKSRRKAAFYSCRSPTSSNSTVSMCYLSVY